MTPGREVGHGAGGEGRHAVWVGLRVCHPVFSETLDLSLGLDSLLRLTGP